jgi:hypothetical protein
MTHIVILNAPTPISLAFLHLIHNLFHDSFPYRQSSRADFVPKFAIGGQALLAGLFLLDKYSKYFELDIICLILYDSKLLKYGNKKCYHHRRRRPWKPDRVSDSL